jgi:hypothetical protein
MRQVARDLVRIGRKSGPVGTYTPNFRNKNYYPLEDYHRGGVSAEADYGCLLSRGHL